MIDCKKYNNSTHFTFYVLIANYKKEEVEIRPVPFCYNKKQLHSLISTQLLFFEDVHIKQVSGLPTTSQKNEYNILFPRNEEGKVDVERGVYDTNNQLRRATFKYDQEG